MIRKLLLLLFLFFSLAGYSRWDQSPKKFKKRPIASDSFRGRVKVLADSIQKNRTYIYSEETIEKDQPDPSPGPKPGSGEGKKEENSWLLPAAGAAVLAAFYYLFRRKTK